MRRLNLLRSGQIGDGAGEFDASRAVIGAGVELHLGHGGFEEVRAGLIQGVKLADFARSHIGVGLQGAARR